MSLRPVSGRPHICRQRLCSCYGMRTFGNHCPTPHFASTGPHPPCPHLEDMSIYRKPSISIQAGPVTLVHPWPRTVHIKDTTFSSPSTIPRKNPHEIQYVTSLLSHFGSCKIRSRQRAREIFLKQNRSSVSQPNYIDRSSSAIPPALQIKGQRQGPAWPFRL